MSKKIDSLISIIVPVYNVETYLNRCVESLVNQTYHNIEIILIDDGSPDDCPRICDEWATQDKRIKVIHKKNGGQSEARNMGIEKASGRFITFVDSDDYIDKKFIECLYTQILETGANIACVSMQEFHDESEIEQDRNCYKLEIYDSKEAIAALFEPSKFKSYVWNKLFARQLFDEIRFPCGQILEDLAIMHKLFEKCKVISYYPAKLYYYFQRAGSSMHGTSTKWLMDWYEFSKERYIYVRDKYPEMCGNYRYFNSVILQCYPLLETKEMEYAEKEFKNNYRFGLYNSDKKLKVKLLLYMLNKNLYCAMWHCAKKNR